MNGAALVLALAAASAQPAAPTALAEPHPTVEKPDARDLVELSGDVAPTHDPAIARQDGFYYVYGTGVADRQPMSARRSRDLVRWERLPPPLPSVPSWAVIAVPGARDVWAPDLSRWRGGYRLYYAVSTFGGQRSVIGLATSPTLDPSASDYGWRDQGLVIASKPGDDYNAIDPNFVSDRRGGAWLAFGSYWSGLKIVRLDPLTGKRTDPEAPPIAIASRERGRDAIEAAFIVDHGGWYWLMASLDHCCRGIRSDYHVVVGRARAITGPYVDRSGKPMLGGGGTDLVRVDPYDPARFKGPGHEGFLHDADGRDYLVFHAYDGAAGGRPTLRIASVGWGSDGWPYLKPSVERPK